MATTVNLHRNTMTIIIQNIDQSQPMVYDDIDNCYIEGEFYCMVCRSKNEVMKFPISRIFRIIEPYMV